MEKLLKPGWEMWYAACPQKSDDFIFPPGKNIMSYVIE